MRVYKHARANKQFELTTSRLLYSENTGMRMIVFVHQESRLSAPPMLQLVDDSVGLKIHVSKQ